MPVGRHLYACYLNNRWLTEEIEFDTMTVRFAGFVLTEEIECDTMNIVPGMCGLLF